MRGPAEGRSRTPTGEQKDGHGRFTDTGPRAGSTGHSGNRLTPCLAGGKETEGRVSELRLRGGRGQQIKGLQCSVGEFGLDSIDNKDPFRATDRKLSCIFKKKKERGGKHLTFLMVNLKMAIKNKLSINRQISKARIQAFLPLLA